MDILSLQNSAPESNVRALLRKYIVDISTLLPVESSRVMMEESGLLLFEDTPSLLRHYLEAYKHRDEFLNALMEGNLDAEEMIQYLMYMALAAFKVYDIDDAISYTKDVCRMSYSPVVKYRVLSEFIIFASCVRHHACDQESGFIRNALREMFARVGDADFVEMSSILLSKSSGIYLHILSSLFREEAQKRNATYCYAEVERRLDEKGSKDLMKYV